MTREPNEEEVQVPDNVSELRVQQVDESEGTQPVAPELAESTDPFADAEALLSEDPDAGFGGQIGIDEIVAAYGAAKLTSEKLQMENMKLTNENNRLRATLRNVVKSTKK